MSRICSDKTGTLTLMEMMVVSAATADAEYQITGDGYASTGEVKKDGNPVGKDPDLELLRRVSMLCNDAALFQQEGVWKVEGDPTEGRFIPSPPNSEWTGNLNKQHIRGSTPSHSSRSTASWLRSTKAVTASSFCWSRERRK